MNKHLFVFIILIGFSLVLAQPTDPTGYHNWKMGLAPHSGSKSTMTLGPIQNEYVAVQILNTSDAFYEAGPFNIGTSSLYSPPNTSLIYSYPSDPWSSHAVFKVDDSYYSYNDSPSSPAPTLLTSTASGHSYAILDTIINEPFPLTGGIVVDSTQYIHSGWLAGGVLIMQNLSPIHVYGNTYTAITWPGSIPSDSLFSPTFWSTFTGTRCDTTGTILIQYIVENPDVVAHDVGVMLEMDTEIGSNDAAPLATSYGYAAVEQEFLLSDVMPNIWYAGEDDPPWGPTTLVAQGILSDLDAVTPDRFLVGSWGTYNSVTWDYTATYGSYYDSGVLIYWYPRTVPPGGSVVYNTYYGLKLPERNRPVANIISPPYSPSDLITTACPGQTILVNCTDDLGVDTTGFAISINGHILVYPDHIQASWTGSDMTNVNFTITPPAGFYTSCETVQVVVFVKDFFENISLPDTLFFLPDLIGPQVISTSISDGDTLGLTVPISAVVEDDCSGVDSSSILVGIVGVLTGAHTFAVGDGAVDYNSATGEIGFNPTSIGFNYLYDDSIIYGISRCGDNVSEDYCGPNPVQDNHKFFYTPDNDTLPPIVADYNPQYAQENTSFPITVIFHDEAGVDTCSPSYIYDGSGSYPAYMAPYLIWDDDGEVDIDYAGRLDLVAIDETTFTTAGVGTIPPHLGGSEITFRVYAYDNDFGRGKIADALPIDDNLQTIDITEVPTATLISPPESSLTSCEDQVIIIQVQCSTGIIADSIQLYVNGVPYDTSSAQLIYDQSSSTIEFHPSGTAVFTDGAVQISLTGLYDSYGTPGMDYNWTFFVDITSPVLSNAIPAQSEEVTDLAFGVTFQLDDIGPIIESTAGLDTNSVQTWVTNSDGTFEVTSFLSHTGNVFNFNTDSAGLSFLDNEIVTVRVRAGDSIAVQDFCEHGANILDTSWTFSMSETPCYRGTNPITPSLWDGYNDYTVFHFPNMRSGKFTKKIYIYDRYEHLVRTITDFGDEGWSWDGKDENNVVVSQGVYVYVIVVDDEAVCNGTISVAR
ncbi:hypothetical protein J7L68_10150 [bacterium]|nr:hypothetical protein [bacterium]